MSNLTISLNDDVVRLARVRAIQEGTSVSAKVREFLAQYAGVGSGAAPAVVNTDFVLTTFDGKTGMFPWIDPCSNASMQDAMDEDEFAKYRSLMANPASP